jgi:hypothetical protein
MTWRADEIHLGDSRAAMTAAGAARYGSPFEAGLIAPQAGARRRRSAASDATGSVRRSHVAR